MKFKIETRFSKDSESEIELLATIIIDDMSTDLDKQLSKPFVGQFVDNARDVIGVASPSEFYRIKPIEDDVVLPNGRFFRTNKLSVKINIEDLKISTLDRIRARLAANIQANLAILKVGLNSNEVQIYEV